MISLFYLVMLFSCLTLLTGYVWLSLRTHSLDSWHVVIATVMGVIFFYEVVREIIICWSGIVPAITYWRIVILRLEHTWLGIFIGEVMKYVYIIRKS